MVALTAGLPNLRPPSCPEESDCTQPKPWQLSVLFGGLALLALGSGGIRSCNIAFGADQFDTKTEKGRTQLKSFFNWWYFSFTVALLIALTVVVYVQTNVSWFLGFVIPTACLAVSITIFLLGRRVYICMKPQGSVFVDICKVINAAWRKRKVMSTFYDALILLSILPHKGQRQFGCSQKTEAVRIFRLPKLSCTCRKIVL